MKTLYHGSDVVIDTIELGKCKPGKDFGKGFYLTEIPGKAGRMAERTARINGGTPVVNAFLMSDARGLSVKVFDKPDGEWAEFVYHNRETEGFVHPYDLVIGPVADDNIRLQFLRMERLGLSFEDIAKMLLYKEDEIQYCFCTQKAITILKKI